MMSVPNSKIALDHSSIHDIATPQNSFYSLSDDIRSGGSSTAATKSVSHYLLAAKERVDRWLTRQKQKAANVGAHVPRVHNIIRITFEQSLKLLSNKKFRDWFELYNYSYMNDPLTVEMWKVCKETVYQFMCVAQLDKVSKSPANSHAYCSIMFHTWWHVLKGPLKHQGVAWILCKAEMQSMRFKRILEFITQDIFHKKFSKRVRTTLPTSTRPPAPGPSPWQGHWKTRLYSTEDSPSPGHTDRPRPQGLRQPRNPERRGVEDKEISHRLRNTARGIRPDDAIERRKNKKKLKQQQERQKKRETSSTPHRGKREADPRKPLKLSALEKHWPT